MGLPTVVWIMAANQQKGALALQAHGAAVIAADSSQLTHHLTTLLVDDQTSLSLRKMSHQASILTASDGTAQVVELLLASHD